MGNKINPNLFRISAGQKSWNSEWCAKTDEEYNNNVYEDIVIAEYLSESPINQHIGDVKVVRVSADPKVIISTSKNSGLLSRGREGLRKSKDDPAAILGKIKDDLSAILGKNIAIDIIEIRRADLNARLVAWNIARQIEKRMPYKRAVKSAMEVVMKAGALGIKISCAGRLNGAEIARAEYFKNGSIPLHTLRANIDYVLAEAHTTYGVIGIKVWIHVSDLKTRNNNQ